MNTFSTSSSHGVSVDSRTPAFTIRFWGVRGGIPTSGPDTAFYGGNTSCVELLVNHHRLIFDGGTGLRALGEALSERPSSQAHLFFTHTQLDRIQGFPYFRPAFQKENTLNIYGPQSSNGAAIKHALAEQMVRPRFHVPLHHMQADLKFQTLMPGAALDLDGVIVEAMALNSGNSSLGFRVTWQNYSIVYATDSYAASQSALQSLSKQADLLIFDAVQAADDYYSPQSLNALKRMETWQESMDGVAGLDVKKIVLSYLDPSHDDAFLSQLDNELRSSYPNVQIAQEGTILKIGQCAAV